MPSLPNGDYVSTVFGRYALPSDDLAGGADSVIASGSPADEDPEYPATNLIAPTNTGHLNLPSRPAKLTTLSGSWELSFASAITVRAAAIIYHNLDAGLDVTIEGGAGFTQAITIPAQWENDWWISPWVEFASAQTFDTWRLSINDDNSLPVQVGRLLLLGQLRQLDTDVRWGVVEDEEQGQIEHVTVGGVETLYELWGPRRSFAGELGLRTDDTASLLTLFRSARHRILPWLLIPDEDVNDAWFVRFQEPRSSRTRDMIEHNIFPFRVKELSRGLPFP